MGEDEKKKLIIRYVKTALSLLLVFTVCLVIENPFEAEDAKGVIWALCDSFTVPGVLFAGIGALSYFAYLGAFDGIGYAFTNFGLHNLWVTKQPKKYKSFYDYKVAKDEKGRTWWPHILIVGLTSLAISLILLIVYFLI